MKKSISIVAVAALVTSMFVACGPSKAEVEAKEKAKQDSLTEVAKADSIMKAEEAMKAAEAAKADSVSQAMKADSIAKAEEAAKGAKKGKK
jgi:mannitol-specific phosphotransferase system IIBC component